MSIEYTRSTRYAESLNNVVVVPPNRIEYLSDVITPTFGDSEKYLLQILMYAIYDNKLSATWGSQSYHIAKCFSEIIKWNDIDLIYKSYPTKNFYQSYKETLIELFNFLNNPEKKQCICSFGLPTHATCLHLTKIITDSGTIVEVCYINTGFGIDSTYEAYEGYCNVFKITYFRLSDSKNFIRFIQPFIFYKYNDIVSETDFKFYMYYNDIDLGVHTDYTVFYDLIYNHKSSYFHELNNLFEHDKYYIFDKRLHVSSKLNTQFLNMWTSKLNDINLTIRENQISLNNFDKLAFKKFKYKINDDVVYLKLQKSGSCTYKSIFYAWIYNSLILAVEDQEKRVENFYNMCIELKKYITINKFLQKPYYERVADYEHNKFYLLNLLNRDKILKFNYSNYNKKELSSISYYDTITKPPNAYIPHSPFSKTELNDIVKKIRTREKIDFFESYEAAIKKPATLSVYDRFHDSHILSELLILILLIEYYNNYKFWSSLIESIKYSTFFELHTFRFELLEHEHLWIKCVFLIISRNIQSNNIEFIDKLKFLERFIKLVKLHDIPELLIRGTRNADENFEMKFIKKIMLDNIIFEEQEEVMRFREFYNVERGYIIINYLHENYNKIYDKFFKINDQSVLLFLLKKLLLFIVNNATYISKKICKINIINLLLVPINKLLYDAELFNIMALSFNMLNDNYYIPHIHASTLDSIYRSIPLIFDNDIFFKKSNYKIYSNMFKNIFEVKKIFDDKITYNVDGSINYEETIENFENLVPYDLNMQIIYNEQIYIPDTTNIKICFKSTDEFDLYKMTDSNKYLVKYDKEIYNTQTDNFLTFEINSEKQVANIKINNEDAEFISNVKDSPNNTEPFENNIQYPFCIFCPAISTNFIVKKKNSYYLTIIKTRQTKNNIFTGAKFTDKYCFFLELPINNNFLTPIFTQETLKIYNSITKYCDHEFAISRNKWDFKIKNINKLIYQYNINNQGIINDYSQKIYPKKNCNDNFCNFINLSIKDTKLLNEIHSAITHAADDNTIKMTDYVELLDIVYDTSNCFDCINKTPKTVSVSQINTDDLHKFLKKHKVCSIKNKDILYSKKNKFEYYMSELKKLRSVLNSKINYSKIDTNDFSIIELIINNYHLFDFILKINLFLKQLENIISFINNNTANCNEVIEIDETIPVFKSTMVIDGIIEIMLGLNLKNEQQKKIDSLMDSFSRPSNKWKIHHFAMGKGKSSVITPMLIVLLAKYNKKINIIVPTHLLKQTHNTLFDIIHYFNININIYDDVSIKQLYLNGDFDKNAVYLIDEFDFMYNPLQSNYNYVINSKSLLNDNNFDYNINIKTINLILDYVINYMQTNKLNEYPTYSLMNEVNDILKNIKNYIKNVSYGMSHLYTTMRYCIPYARQHSPLENSSFKSNILTIVLTILYFYDNNFILEDNDLYIISTQQNAELNQLICEYYNINNYFDFASENHIKNKQDYFDKKDHTGEEFDKRRTIFQWYFPIIVKSIKETTKIMNTSFLDIINSESIWQVGYSGTTNLLIPNEPILMKYSHEIEKDNDEIIGTYFAITGNYSNSKNDFYYIHTFNQIYCYFKPPYNINVLIDACAYFRNFDNSFVAMQLHKVSNKKVIFLLNDDSRKIIKDGHIYTYDETVYNHNEIIYYYSQRHIVGIDFKQPNILNGLVLIDDKNNYTQVAQAIFRMRKLNRGHIVNIGYCGTKNDMNQVKIYEQLVDNDKIFLKNTENALRLQFIKNVIRKYITHKHTETILTPLYSIKNIDYPQIIDLFINNKINRDIYSGVTNVETAVESLELSTEIKTSIKLLCDLFNSDSTINKINLLFDKQCIETNVENITNIVNESNVITQFDVKSFATVNTGYLLKIYYDPTSPNVNSNYIYTYYTINTSTVQFSINLFSNSNNSLVMFVVRISPLHYLVENIYNIEYYYNILPIYTMHGNIINHAFINEKIKDVPTQINTYELFNCTLKKEHMYINFYDLLDIPKNSHTLDLDKDNLKNFHKLTDIMNFIYHKTNHTKTSNLATDIDVDAISEYISRTFPVKCSYESYISNAFKQSNFKKIISQELTPIIDSIDLLPALYINYLGLSYHESRGNLIHFDNITLSGGYYHKYLKYKQKYIHLKNKINQKKQITN